ncbi:hypothetical protein PVAP13_7NG435625 [Panicum virgatum]|uniref:Reverse transcriptase zinc-binding domain-containing protein n=1 Tax=Panicum virgatum TaxID=38727 RepID=A0A8T0QHR2_PANVG|nr:hypothetical protein PVAP13_7NG435625 [Panicum virgatum]
MLNLERFARALRLRWLWQEWVAPDKAWVGTETPFDNIDRLLFAACTTITLGNGSKTKFWSDGWLQGCRPKDLAPNLYKISKRKKISVQTAFTANSWIHDIPQQPGLTTTHLSELAALWIRTQNIQLQPNQQDQISWKLTTSGQYSASSTYKAQFFGCTKIKRSSYLRNSWAPPKCKFFIWRVTQNRVWTSDRLQKRGWTHSPSCPLCRFAPESALHLLAECRYTRRVWKLIAEWTAQPTMRTQEWQPSDSVAQWWQNSATTPSVPRKAMAIMTMLVSWEIWKERNRRVFRHHETSAPDLLSLIKQEALDWVVAGAKDLATLLSRE